MKKIFVLSFLFSLQTFADNKENISLQAEQLKFRYQNFDGDLSILCSHEIENALSQDWTVKCESDGFKRSYSVHLWVTRYLRQNAPKVSIESLYWVMESYPSSKGYSSTNWIHMNEISTFAGASLSVGVDNESAGLYLEISPSRAFFAKNL